jgi:thiopurine S-methyltransferase
MKPPKHDSKKRGLMEPNFWQKKWEANEIAFHESKANPLLLQHFKQLSVKKGSRIFLPLCGKTLDISWLLSNGYRVAGAELSKIAIEQLFTELGVIPEISIHNELYLYSASNINIFVGDIFNLSASTLGQIDAIYDRAALVALPKEMRNQYSTHLMAITNNAPQLLICYEYNQNLLEGPPFSIHKEEVKQHYNAIYNLTLLDSQNLEGGLKGICPTKENVWLLKRNL